MKKIDWDGLTQYQFERTTTVADYRYCSAKMRHENGSLMKTDDKTQYSLQVETQRVNSDYYRFSIFKVELFYRLGTCRREVCDSAVSWPTIIYKSPFRSCLFKSTDGTDKVGPINAKTVVDDIMALLKNKKISIDFFSISAYQPHDGDAIEDRLMLIG
jgi:hypothetical protein